MVNSYKSQVTCEPGESSRLYDDITRVLSISGDYQHNTLGGRGGPNHRLIAYQPRDVAVVFVSDAPDMPLISIEGRNRSAVKSRAEGLAKKLNSLGLEFSAA